MNILIIEDEAAIRQTLQDILEINGHTVLAAKDGVEGVKLVENHPDIILCDIGMPGMNGYEVITAIQQNPVCRDIPFIFLTAKADREDQRKGMALGADDYITKPFTEKDIREAISARIKRQRPLRERLEKLMAVRHAEVGAEWSHELMTPLNGVLGGLQLIESEVDTIKGADLKDLLGLIRQGAERQYALARKIVFYYELERLKGDQSIRTIPCEIVAAIDEGANRAANEASRMRDLKMDCESCMVQAVAGHLVEAFAEIVGNALKFSKPGQPVTVTGRREQSCYQVEILDEGPGMTEEQRSNLLAFTRYRHVQHEQQGLGLGLAIARAATEIVGGRFLLADNPGGRGLSVRLRFPIT